jgi:hypothetical protein
MMTLEEKKPAKKYISLQEGVKLRTAPFLLGGKLSFILSFLFPERLQCCYMYFHCSHVYNYYIYLEPCALNAEFQQHFIPRFNKTSLLCGPPSKRVVKGGERKPKDRVKTG